MTGVHGNIYPSLHRSNIHSRRDRWESKEALLGTFSHTFPPPWWLWLPLVRPPSPPSKSATFGCPCIFIHTCPVCPIGSRVEDSWGSSEGKLGDPFPTTESCRRNFGQD
eukprot:scaffold776_cov347-Pavlova_lutheri.AAC.25